MDDAALIAGLRELLAKATPGPWHFDGPPDNHIIWRDGENRICFMAHSNGRNPDRDTATAALIVEAVNALPHLLARIEALTAERDAPASLNTVAAFKLAASQIERDVTVHDLTDAEIMALVAGVTVAARDAETERCAGIARRYHDEAGGSESYKQAALHIESAIRRTSHARG